MYTQLKEGKQYSFSIELTSSEISENSIAEAITFFDRTSSKEKDVREIEYSQGIDIPSHVFLEGNNGLRAIVRFLKEEKKFSFSKIAKLLSRDPRTIWCAYHSIEDKFPSKKPKRSQTETIALNSSIFSDRKFSILESAAMHLLKKYSVKETAQILGRNQMTIWTVKRRAELKLKQTNAGKKTKKLEASYE